MGDMYDLCVCDVCKQEFKTKKIRKDPYKNICRICRLEVLGKRCLHCNDAIAETEKEEPWNYYCGYCESVYLGKPDATWLPSVRKDEIEKKGFHRC